MKKLLLLSMVLFVFINTISAQKQNLIIDYITSPQYASDSVTLVVVVKYLGVDTKGFGFVIKVSDAEISYNDAVKESAKGATYVQAISKQDKWLKKSIDLEDAYWEVEKELEYEEFFQGQSKAFVINLGNLWPYDPNCDIKVEILNTDADTEEIESQLNYLKEEFPKKSKDELIKDHEFYPAPIRYTGYFFAGG